MSNEYKMNKARLLKWCDENLTDIETVPVGADPEAYEALVCRLYTSIEELKKGLEDG